MRLTLTLSWSSLRSYLVALQLWLNIVCMCAVLYYIDIGIIGSNRLKFSFSFLGKQICKCNKSTISNTQQSLIYSQLHTRLAWWRNSQGTSLLVVYFIYSSNLPPCSRLNGDLHQVMIFRPQWSHFLRWSCIEVPRPSYVALVPVTITCITSKLIQQTV